MALQEACMQNNKMFWNAKISFRVHLVMNDPARPFVEQVERHRTFILNLSILGSLSTRCSVAKLAPR